MIEIVEIPLNGFPFVAHKDSKENIVLICIYFSIIEWWHHNVHGRIWKHFPLMGFVTGVSKHVIVIGVRGGDAGTRCVVLRVSDNDRTPSRGFSPANAPPHLKKRPGGTQAGLEGSLKIVMMLKEQMVLKSLCNLCKQTFFSLVSFFFLTQLILIFFTFRDNYFGMVFGLKLW